MTEYEEYEGVYFWIPKCRDESLDGHLMKIGRSKDVLKRAQSLQTGCPYPLLQLWRLWVPGWSTTELERHMHSEFSRFNVHHEWFSLPSIYWEVWRDTMEIYYEFPTWECLIDNGDVGRWYVPKQLSNEALDGVVKEATTRILSGDSTVVPFIPNQQEKAA